MMSVPSLPGMDNFDLKDMAAFFKQIEAAKANLGGLVPNPSTNTATPTSVSPELIDQCTQKYNIIFSQQMYIQSNMANALKVRDGGYVMRTTATSGYHDYTASAPVALEKGNLVGIKDLMGNVNQVMKGKFFLCRTITASSKAVAAVEMGVEDPKGIRAVRLALYNYSEKANVPGTDFEGVVPLGAYLVVKNPWFKSSANGGLVLRCDSPGNVEILSEKEVKDKFPDCKWRPTLREETSTYFWDQMTLASYSDKERAKKLKDIGNRAWVEKRFTDAIRWYKMGLDYAKEPGDCFTILNNMTAALMGMECWNAALKCVDEALQIEGKNDKALYRKGKCLMGLEKWDDSIKFIENLEMDNEKGDFKKLLEEARGLQKLSENPDLLKQRWVRLRLGIDKSLPLVCYKGPVSISNIPGKGRGLIATKPLAPGQLVMVSKAFAFSSLPIDPRTFFLGTNFGSKTGDLGPCHNDQISLVANKLRLDPELGKEFFALTAGKDLGHLSDADEKCGLLDLQRIDKVLKLNSFGNNAEINKMKKMHKDLKTSESGIWILPSYINHSCSDANTVHNILGDLMIVMAVKEVNEGEEITLPYIDLGKTYEERKENCESTYEFTCSCSLCRLEGSEPQSVHDQREKLLKKLTKLNKPKPVIDVIQDIINLGKSHPEFNMALLNEAITGGCSVLLTHGRFKDCFTISLKIMPVLERNPTLYLNQLILYSNILFCLIQMTDVKEVKKWVGKLKQFLLTFDGCLEAMKATPERKMMMDVLKKSFKIDFFKD